MIFTIPSIIFGSILTIPYMLDLIGMFWYTANVIKKEDDNMHDIKVNFPTNKEAVCGVR